jgi:hypothetical protein
LSRVLVNCFCSEVPATGEFECYRDVSPTEIT